MSEASPPAGDDSQLSTPECERSASSSSNHSTSEGTTVFAMLLRFGLAAIILFVAIGIAAALVKSKKTSERTIGAGAPLVVRTITSEPRAVDRVWEGYGTVRTMIASDIVAEVAGRVVARPDDIEPGVPIRTGDLILQLDDSDYANAYESASQAADALQAQVDGLAVETERLSTRIEYAEDEINAAERDLTRTEDAIAQGAGSPGERDVKLQALRRLQREQLTLKQQLELIPSRRAQLMAQLAGQRANARIAKENQVRARIASPLDGEIASVSPRAGDWVGNGSVVARVVDLARLEVPLKLPAGSSSWVKIGDAVSLWIGDALDEPAQRGTITRVSPEADAMSRTITVYVEVTQDPADAGRLLPGQFVLGRVMTRDPSPRVVIPRRAVQDGYVFVAASDDREDANGGLIVQRVPVRAAYGFDADLPVLDEYETQWVALEHGREPPLGSAVIISLLDQLEVGMHVQPASSGEGSP
ncbi:MAG: HlyD family efflux transporter periplasmic adaptor subunit [Phycisphaerales bacterium]|nr:HlyD family efflux transporter periplasmic adaptor subunit [Phycisphaerales bacterium]